MKSSTIPLTFQQQFINFLFANDTNAMIDLLNNKDESIKNEINRIINIVDKDLRVTPVIVAAKNKNIKMVIALLNAGADPYIEYVEGTLPRKLQNDKDSHEEIADLLLLNNCFLPTSQPWFFHEKICYLDTFSPPKKGEAACRGVADLGMQACLSKDIPMFNLRNHIIHNFPPKEKFTDQIKIIEAERINVMRLATKKILEAEESVDESNLTKEMQQERYNNIREQALNSLSLRDRALHASELLIYPYNMMMFQKTKDKYQYLWENEVLPQDIKTVLSLVKPLTLESQKIDMLISFSRANQLPSLRNDLEKLTKILNEEPRIPCPISMFFKNWDHVIEVGYDEGWHCIDANNLNKLYFTNEEIANQIFNSLYGNKSPHKTVIFEVKLFADEKHKELIINKINQWRKTIEINQDNGLIKTALNERDSQGITWLYFAINYNYLEDAKKLLEAGADPNLAWQGFTPLWLAVRNGHLEIVKLLLKKGAAINQASNRKFTALHHAVSAGHFEIVKLLLTKGAAINLANDEGFTPLLLAAEKGKFEIVKHLLKNNADPNLANNVGTPPLSFAAHNDHLEIVKLLLKKAAAINLANNEGFTPLLLAAEKGKFEIVKHLLKNNADPNLANNVGTPPLSFAARNGHLEIVKLLLKKAAAINQLNNRKFTALHHAVSTGHFEIVKLLLAKGAAINQANENGSTPLLLAIGQGQLEVVKILLENNADPNLANNLGVTTLQQAAFLGHLEIVKLLLGKNVKLEETAINYAIHNGHLDVIHALLEKGMSLNYTINDGITTLHTAAQVGHVNIIELILNQTKIEPNVANNNGITPLFIAAMQGHLQVVKFFCEKSGIDLTKKIATDAQSLFQLAKILKGEEVIVNYFKNNNVNPDDTQYKISISPLEIAQIFKRDNIVQYNINPNEILTKSESIKVETGITTSIKLNNEDIFKKVISKISNFNTVSDFNDLNEFINQFKINDKIKNNDNVQIAIGNFILKYYEKNNAKHYILESLVYELHDSCIVKTIENSKAEAIFKKAASECVDQFSNIIKLYDATNLSKTREDKKIIKNLISYYIKAADLANLSKETQNQVLSSFFNELVNNGWQLQLNHYNLELYKRIINISPFDTLHLKPVDKLAEDYAQLKDINIKLTTIKMPTQENNMASYGTFFVTEKNRVTTQKNQITEKESPEPVVILQQKNNIQI